MNININYSLFNDSYLKEMCGHCVLFLVYNAVDELDMRILTEIAYSSMLAYNMGIDLR